MQKITNTSAQPSKALLRLLRLKEVLALVPVCKTSWYAGIRDGRYPQPVKLSPRVTCWREEDIRALIAAA